MKTVTYKDFHAAVDYEDGVLFVRVLHIEDLLIAQCKSVDEIQPALEELIDAYLEDCRELGKAPSKPFSGTFNVRLGPDLHRKAAVAAAERGSNLNSWIVEAVSEKLECDRLGSRVDTVFANARQTVELLRLAGHHMNTPVNFSSFRARKADIRPNTKIVVQLAADPEATLDRIDHQSVWTTSRYGQFRRQN